MLDWVAGAILLIVAVIAFLIYCLGTAVISGRGGREQ